MSTREEMIAHKRTVEEIADELGADILAYLSMEGVYEAVGTAPEDHCDACFTGRYPLGDPEDANGKFALEDIAVVPAEPRRGPLGRQARATSSAAGRMSSIRATVSPGVERAGVDEGRRAVVGGARRGEQAAAGALGAGEPPCRAPACSGRPGRR